MNTKEALSWPEAMSNHDLLKLTLRSLLVGGGAYGAARLGKDIYNEFKGPEKPKNELPVVIPQQKLGSMEDTPPIDWKGKFLYPSLAGGVGVGAGFFGASKLYDSLKNHFLEKELKKKQQEYVGALQQVNQKMGHEHPFVDELLTGIITKLGELSKQGKVSYPSQDELWADAKKDIGEGISSAGTAVKDFVSEKAQQLGSFGGDLAQKGWNHAKGALDWGVNHTNIGGALKAGLVLLAGGTGAATYMIAKNLEKKKEEAARQSQIPTDLKLTPVSSSPNAIPGQSH